MRLLQAEIWAELKEALEAYVKALEENTDIKLIESLAQKIRELEGRLSSMKCSIEGKFYTFKTRPQAILRMHLGETPEFV